MDVKLGRLPAKVDNRNLLFATYFQLPTVPEYQNWATKCTKDYGMMANDKLGDCTCAAMGHAIQAWSANVSEEHTLSDQDIISAYEAITGYNPADPSTDRGAVELNVLNYWRTTGISGHKISAYTSINPENITHVKAGIYLFGGIYIGISLPYSAQTQTTWSVPWYGKIGDGLPGSWGGHAVYVVAYDAKSVWCITWGQLKRMTWRFFTAYCEEAYALISPDWFNGEGKDPNGFDLTALQSDINEITA
jgi:hypothetical protein